MDRCLGVGLVQKYNEPGTIKVDSARCLALFGVHLLGGYKQLVSGCWRGRT